MSGERNMVCADEGRAAPAKGVRAAGAVRASKGSVHRAPLLGRRFPATQCPRAPGGGAG